MKQGKKLLVFFVALTLVIGMLPMDAMAAKKNTAKKITLDHREYVLKKGKSLKLKASVTPKSAKTDLTWKSSNKKVAVVNSKGIVKAVASKGKATITVNAGKKKASCKITIGTPVKKITASNLKLNVGESKKILAKISPKKAAVKKLTYKSNNLSVAKVTKKGKVTALKQGKAKITITAADCQKVKKVITVAVVKKNEGALTPTPELTVEPTATPTVEPTATPTSVPTVEPTVTAVPEPTATPTSQPPQPSQPSQGPTATPAPGPDIPEFSISLENQEMPLEVGESRKTEVIVSSSSGEVTGHDIIWSSTDDNIAAITSADGEITGIMPGTATIEAKLKKYQNVSASMQVTVSDEGIDTKTVTTGQELADTLKGLDNPNNNVLITLNTEEEQVTIPEGNYGNVMLIVDAPNASIENSAQFKQVLIKQIAADTWREKNGNKIFMDSTASHLIVDANGSPNVYLLDGTEAITIENNGNLQELLIASAAKVLIKSDSVAMPVNCQYYNSDGGIGELTTYVPLDIYSTTAYRLKIGPGGEQTAVKVREEDDIPEVSGLGTISVTIDSTGENREIIAENNNDDIAGLHETAVEGRILKNADDPGNIVSATVYLVNYSVDISEDNVSIYLNGSNIQKADTDPAGNYRFDPVKIGNYVIVVEAEGYPLITQNIYITTAFDKDRIYKVDDIILMDEAGKAGAVNGRLIDVAAGEPVWNGLTVILRKGMNNITTNEVGRVTSDENGTFDFQDITPGQYTIQVRDEAAEPEYVSTYENITIQPEAAVTCTIYMSKILDSDNIRFALSWGTEADDASPDLDIYLYGPDPFHSGEYDVYFSEDAEERDGHLMDGRYVTFANLDVDDKEYEGPETITVRALTAGQYKPNLPINYTQELVNKPRKPA